MTKGKLKAEHGQIYDEENPQMFAEVFSSNDKEDAERLVKCWNNHDKLVEALKNSLKTIKLLVSDTDSTSKNLALGDTVKNIEKLLEDLK